MKPVNSTAHRRIGVICPAISGHLNPALALAGELQDRGYEVAYFGPADAAAKCRSAEIRHIVIGERSMPAGTVFEQMRHQGELSGREACRWILRCLQQEAEMHFADLPEALRRWRPDGLLVDQVQPGAASVAEHGKHRYWTLCHALPVNLDLTVPPFISTLDAMQGRLGCARNFLAWMSVLPLALPLLRTINRQRRALGLRGLAPGSFGESKEGVLAQIPRAFEFPQRRIPPTLRFTGPWVRAKNRGEPWFPWNELDGRPLIYASMGTLQNRIGDVFRLIAEACQGLGAQLVISQGAHDATPLPYLPGKPIIVPMAPQLALLERASLVITHAGLNTALETLAAGVPMVALPVTNDQPGVAARIRRCGAGELLPFDRLNVPELRKLVESVLREPKYREAARRMRGEIQRANGLRQAADLVEEAFPLGTSDREIETLVC